MAEGLFRRKGGHAVPVDQDATDALFAVKDGALFRANIASLKNEPLVRLFFALRDLVADATDTAKEPTKEWLLKGTGFCDPVFHPDGTMTLKARSIRKMQGAEFRQFFEKALALIQRTLEISRRDDLLKRYFDYLDPALRAEAREMLKPQETVARRTPEKVHG